MPDRVTSAPGVLVTHGSDARSMHRAAVERLTASYDAIPRDAHVRLAKRTSNLFRARDRSRTAGLDVSGLDGVIMIDA
ncbi:MAG TPA: hypothetical protein VFX53_14635, partial [Pedococcus sp.]|nr:hypothetical protein [Pedococcus sp.]